MGQGLVTAFGLGLMLGAAVAPALAATPSGTAIAVVQSSEADGLTGRRILAPAAPVYSGDRINTGRIGEAQIRFSDGTKLVVGPNSSMVLDAFVFNNDNTARQVSIDAVRGAFRFITGSSRKDAYAITTPTATIAVRGTALDFNVDVLGTTRVAVFDGSTLTCDRLLPPRRTCIVQTSSCEVSVIERGLLPRELVSRTERQRELLRYFPYVNSQDTLLAAFRIDVDACGLFRTDIQPPPEVEESITLIVVPPANPPPQPQNDECAGNCGVGLGGEGGNGTDNEGNGGGPPDGRGGPDDHPGGGPPGG